MTARDTHRTIDAIWKIESPRLIATIARMVRDVGLAEELAQDALVVALEQWPTSGVPDNPGAWLTQTAKHRAIDRIRRERMAGRKLEALGKDMEGMLESADDTLIDALDDDIGDDMLRLIFTACHPVLSIEAQVALTLRLLGGLTTDEIARAFLVPEATVAQRIVRAKRSLADASVTYEVPRGDELRDRLAAVLRVVYLVFNEGYAATTGGDWMRPALCAEAQRLGRVLAGLMPAEAEVHGLVALMEMHASRAGARIGPDGEPILLLEQDRGRWDRLLIGLGLKALQRAERLGGAKGPYALQAAIAACHARAARAEDTDWARIAALYAALVDVVRSPVVELNRAVAVSMSEGPGVALDIVDSLVDEPSMRDYHLLPSVQGDLLFRLGRFAEAREAFLRAAAMTRNEREQALLTSRAAACTE
ncbi:RNA polymerase subunit sigma-24 [Luteibacter rhizovicinus DSM 16549]|uniref:RNA polymerase subunit sigma-24 n=1 Tax=Luteibacter rhizovicinus DSM 16549 TaxID=1440763 RepID=A0A0G9HHT7_9GAMM|nr:RNA polymerase sigma factor [Luteibacter rhizovicinus]APG03577.1 RNA polymerase subunit sigma-24 [Luteibacter rhizovicinus DSM 16549]KLD68744.1 RNA polymerase subunit sigma-24 [Luteibacter rhizovicinus DSM 16549]KLD77045.1 RNA polymerase subunit sigma-24 [Xanthomonas hyacinthi DSM 19077]